MVDLQRVNQLLHYDPDTGVFTWKVRRNHKAKVGDIAGAVNSYESNLQYISIKIDRRLYKAHRLAFLLMSGRWPENIDHINGNGLDNRWCNLREVFHQENGKNQKQSKNNKSGQTGVSWHKQNKKWIAKESQVYLGSFTSYEDAISARKQAEIDYGYHPNHGRKGNIESD